MVIAGLILLVLGAAAKLAIVWTLGNIVLILGAVFMLGRATGHAVGGRRHCY